MQSENLYIGDEKFQKFLDHYNCPTPLAVVKLKFAGAICSPNVNLRPTDVISSLFEEERQPRLETKAEAELFFRFFMGLWDDMFITVKTNTLHLPSFEKQQDADALEKICLERADALENGFVEGFWGGCDTLKIPQFVSELISSLTDLAESYAVLSKQFGKGDTSKQAVAALTHTDQMVTKALAYLIEHYVLPHIGAIERTVN